MAALTRRGFLTGVGFAGLAAAGATILAGCASGTSQAGNAGDNQNGSGSSGESAHASVTDSSSLAAAGEDGVAQFYSHVTSVTALAHTYPAGEKVVGVAIEYDTDVDASSLEAGNGGVGQQATEKGLGTYYVLGRTISDVYVSDAAATGKTDGKASGKYAIVELDPTDAGSQTLMFQMTRGCVGSNGPVGLDSGSVRVCQIKDARSITGETLAGDPKRSRYLVTGSVFNADADAFKAGSFDDDVTGFHASFELRLPDDYDASKSYPLVLFLPDAGVTTSDPKVNLRQGLGALAWADGSAFVLTVAGTCADVPTCLDLIDDLSAQGYAIDQSRLYGTGESAGCMALIAYAADHPDDNRFAALMLVAGQGNMTPIASTPLLIFVSEDDESSYGGMTDAAKGIATIGVPYVDEQLDCTYDYDGEGHTSGKWVDYAATGQKNPSGNQEGAKPADSTRTLDELMGDLSSACGAACSNADAQGAHIVFLHVKQGTLDGTDSSVQGGNTHNFTWQYAYNIPELRQWILAQSK